MVSNCLVATILSHRFNSCTGSGETKVESHASSNTQPNLAALLLNTALIQPRSTNVSEETPCTWQPWLARTVPSPPQESLVCNETRTSLPTKPYLTWMTLGQLCVAQRTSRSRSVTTEPGRELRVSDGTAGAAVQRPYPLLHPAAPPACLSILRRHSQYTLLQNSLN